MRLLPRRATLALTGLVVVIVGLVWLVSGLRGWFDPGQGAGGTGESSAGGTAVEDSELRIDIVRTSEQAAAEHARILSRYSGNVAAREWVADCVQGHRQTSAAAAAVELHEDWLKACWREYARQVE